MLRIVLLVMLSVVLLVGVSNCHKNSGSNFTGGTGTVIVKGSGN